MKKTLLIIGLFIGYSIVYAQIGINTTTPESTLDIWAKNHLGSVDASEYRNYSQLS